MNSLFICTVFAVASAAQLPSKNYIPQAPSNVYIPQGNADSSGLIRGGGGGSGNTRPQQDVEKNAAIVKQEQEISDTGKLSKPKPDALSSSKIADYHFGFETSNGIRAEEAGGTDQAQGGFAYKGDDGHTYTVTYTAGEGGFRPQAEHLPIAPPTPEAILLALQQNERDEAAGIFDDGQYHPDAHGNGQNKPSISGSSFASSSSNQAAFASSSHQSSISSSSGYQY